jgi:undecaprenyl pyrophosphate phosphatase UppP
VPSPRFAPGAALLQSELLQGFFYPGAALLQSELLQGFFYCRDTFLLQAEPVEWGPLVLGTLVAAVIVYLSIHFFMRLIEQVGMLPFVIYRLLLGVFLLLLFV